MKVRITLNKTELVSAVAERTKMPKKSVETVVNATIKTICERLKDGDKISIAGFGSFETKQRAERRGKNIRTGEPIVIPATRIPAFKAGKDLKEIVKSS
jgi:Bacterial nucleoid DNA-binding protein